MTRPRRSLSVECLENREMPATFGVPWPDADDLTLRFVPDGTLIAGRPSELFRTLDSELPTAVWQREILRAFQAWAVTTHINLSVVTDDGLTEAPAVGPSKSAEIRVSALPLSPSTLAIAAPYDPTAGEFAGDVLLNSNYTFGVGDTAGYDLFSVFLHEAGHVFGIEGHGNAPEGSVMHEEYEGVRTGLTPWDVEAIRDLYRPRSQDWYDGSKGFKNETFATATRIPLGNQNCDGNEFSAKPSFSTTDKKPQQDSSSQSSDKKPSFGFTGPGGDSKSQEKSSNQASDGKPSNGFFGFGGQSKPPSSSFGLGGDKKPQDKSSDQTSDGKPQNGFFGTPGQPKQPDSSSSQSGDGKSSHGSFGHGDEKKSHGKSSHGFSSHWSHNDFSFLFSDKKPQDKSPGGSGDNKSQDKSPSGSSSGKPPNGFFGFGPPQSSGSSSGPSGDKKPPEKSSDQTSEGKPSNGTSDPSGDKKPQRSSSGPSGDGKSSNGFFGPGGDKKPNGCGSTLVKTGPLAQIKGELTTGADVDVYRFDVGQGVDAATVRLQTSGEGLLTPRLTVYNANRQVIDTLFAKHPIHKDLTIPLGKMEAGTTFYVEVEGATDDVFAVGPYRLNIEPDKAPVASSKSKGPGSGFKTSDGPGNGPSKPDDLPAAALHKNDDFDTAFRLSSHSSRSSDNHERRAFDWISDGTDVDFYKVRTPKATKGEANSLRATVLRFRDDGPKLKITVYDADRQIVPADVVVNEGSVYTIQTGPVVANATYYVVVRPFQSASIVGRLNYSLTVAFDANATPLETFVTGTLSAAGRQDSRILKVDKSEMFHLVLSANSAEAKVDVGLSFTMLDEDGRTVLRMSTRNGESVSTKTLLTQGTYTLLVEADVPDGTRLPPLFWELRGIRLSSPIGPRPEDVTLDVVGNAKAPDAAKPAAVESEVSNRAFLTVQAPASDLGWEGQGPQAQRVVQAASPVPQPDLPEIAPAVTPEAESVARRVDATPPSETPAAVLEVSIPASDAPVAALEVSVPETLPLAPLVVPLWETAAYIPELEGTQSDTVSGPTSAPQTVASPASSNAHHAGVPQDARVAAFWAQVSNSAIVTGQVPSTDPGSEGRGPQTRPVVFVPSLADAASVSATATLHVGTGTTPTSWSRGSQPQPTGMPAGTLHEENQVPQQAPDTAVPSDTGVSEVFALGGPALVDTGGAASEGHLVPMTFAGANLDVEAELVLDAPGSQDPASRDAARSGGTVVAAGLPILVTVLMVGQLPLWMGGGFAPSGGRPALKKQTPEGRKVV